MKGIRLIILTQLSIFIKFINTIGNKMVGVNEAVYCFSLTLELTATYFTYRENQPEMLDF